MKDTDRDQLIDLRDALLGLHKTLLDWERVAYERFHGRVTGHALLQAILTDPQFSWLRPLSELIARIDQMLEDEQDEQDPDVIVSSARTIVSPPEASEPYARRYREALQDHPDAVFAHRRVVELLARWRDTSFPSQRRAADRQRR